MRGEDKIRSSSSLYHKQVTHYMLTCFQCGEIVCRSHRTGHNCMAMHRGGWYCGEFFCSDECLERKAQ